MPNPHPDRPKAREYADRLLGVCLDRHEIAKRLRKRFPALSEKVVRNIVEESQDGFKREVEDETGVNLRLESAQWFRAVSNKQSVEWPTRVRAREALGKLLGLNRAEKIQITGDAAEAERLVEEKIREEAAREKGAGR